MQMQKPTAQETRKTLLNLDNFHNVFRRSAESALHGTWNHSRKSGKTETSS